MITVSMSQQPNNGITLLINGTAFTNPEALLACYTNSNISDPVVVYYCTAKQSARGIVTIKANTEFCGSNVESQKINMSVVEQRMTDVTQNEHGMFVQYVVTLVK